MAYSIDAITDDCYPGTTCLINKLGIHDENMLAETEAAIILGKASLLEQSPIPGDFDFDHYKRIHHFLFCDLYDWAGETRKRARLIFLKREQRSSRLIKSRIVQRRAFPGWQHSIQMD